MHFKNALQKLTLIPYLDYHLKVFLNHSQLSFIQNMRLVQFVALKEINSLAIVFEYFMRLQHKNILHKISSPQIT